MTWPDLVWCDDRTVPRSIHYARSGDANIAYEVRGDGPFDLVLVPGFFSHLEIDWDHPDHARFLNRLASFARLIRFDKRGTGLSDRVFGLPDFETRMDDVRAVMDAVGSEQASLFGYSEGGPLAVLFAAAYPARTRALVLYGTYAKRCDPDEDYPWAQTKEERLRIAAELERTWGENVDLSTMIPNADEAMAAWFQRRGRSSLSPAAARDLILMNSQADVPAILPLVQCPSIVLHRRADRDAQISEGRYVAAHIPGARFIELEGDEHVPWVRSDEILDPVEEFLTGSRPAPTGRRVLATLLFTDIVGSTAQAMELGDNAWTLLLESHNGLVRSEIARFAGEEIRSTGDGFLAMFDGPARAIRCALELERVLQPLGLNIRAGLHSGEVELHGDAEPQGIAIHVGARIAALAEAGEVLVSATTRDLVAGSGLSFEDRGEHELKGLEEKRRLFAVVR